MQIPSCLTSAALAPSPLLSLQKEVFLEMLGKFCYTSKQSTEEGCQQQFSNLLPRLLKKLHPLRMACGQSTAWMSQLLWDTSYSKLKIKIILFLFGSFQGHQHDILNSSLPHLKHILSCCFDSWLHALHSFKIFQNKGDARLPLSSVATSIKVPAERCSHNWPIRYSLRVTVLI